MGKHTFRQHRKPKPPYKRASPGTITFPMSDLDTPELPKAVRETRKIKAWVNRSAKQN